MSRLFPIFIFLSMILAALEAASLPKPVCPNPRIQQAYQQKAQSLSRLKIPTTQYAIAKTVFSVNQTQNFRVDEGARNLEFILLFQDISATSEGNLRVNIWVEKSKFDDPEDNYLNTSTGLSDKKADRQAMIEEMGELMVTEIVPSMVSSFGAIQPVVASKSDGLNVLIYDIRDDFNFSGSFVGGYFDPADKFDAIGNRMNSIHMDLYPSNPGGAPIRLPGFGIALPRKDFYHVLAHELQHLIHSQFDNNETIWVNEGFSQFAIYRVFHQKRFRSGAKILNSPNDAPSQVEFWLQDPDFSLLMSSDEPGISGGSRQRSDTAELRGVGYLFFTYLWEALGGKVGDSGRLEANGADALFRTMIASTNRGIGSLEPTLNSQSKNFRDLFSRFAYGLVEEISADTPFEFFNYHVDGSRNANLKMNLSPSVVDENFSPRSFQLAGYEFSFHQFLGSSSESTSLELTSSRDFDLYEFVNENGSWKLSSFSHSNRTNLWIPKSSSNLVILVNSDLASTSIQAKFLSSLSSDNSPAAPQAVDEQIIVEGGELNPITISSRTIKTQRFTNSTSTRLDLLNPQPDAVNIRKCKANESCIQASFQKVSSDPASRIIRRTSVKIDGVDHFFSDLQLEPAESYDLYYANTSDSSLNLTLRATPALDLFSVTSGEPTTFPVIDIRSDFLTSAGGGGCFIASVAFGGQGSEEVILLSGFRDEILLRTASGKAFVNLYYTYSPRVANLIQESTFLKFLTKGLLFPVLVLALCLSHLTLLLPFLLGMALLLFFLGFPKRAAV